MPDDDDLNALLADFADEDAKMAGEGDLKAISELANKQLQLASDIDALKLQLQVLEEQHRQIEQEQLPDAMDAAGVSEFKLSDGSKITVKPVLQTSFKADLKEAAIAWLDENGHGSIVKHEVSCSFKKDEHELAQQALEALMEAGFQPVDKEDVHYQTLQAWGRKQAEEGLRPPEEFFHVFDLRVAKIQPPKK